MCEWLVSPCLGNREHRINLSHILLLHSFLDNRVHSHVSLASKLSMFQLFHGEFPLIDLRASPQIKVSGRMDNG